MFDIHKVKPLHGWREFLGEVGIIVLGVLIALAAEQFVEAMHWADQVRDAKAAMTRELGDDDGAQAMARLAISPCIDGSLARLEQQLVMERDLGVALPQAPLAAPFLRTWDGDAWRAAQSLGVASHMDATAMYAWSAPYSLIDDMNQATVREYNDWAPLIRTRAISAHPSEAERERLFAAIANARRDNDLMVFTSEKFVRFAAEAGVAPSDKVWRHEVVRESAAFPGCHQRRS